MIDNSTLQTQFRQFLNSILHVRSQTDVTTRQMPTQDIIVLVSFACVVGIGFTSLLWLAGAISFVNGAIVFVGVVVSMFGYFVVFGFVEIKHTRKSYEKVDLNQEVTADTQLIEDPIAPILLNLNFNMLDGTTVTHQLDFGEVKPENFIKVLEHLVGGGELSESKLVRAKPHLLNIDNFKKLAQSMCQVTVKDKSKGKEETIAKEKPFSDGRIAYELTPMGVQMLKQILVKVKGGDFGKANEMLASNSNLNPNFLLEG